MTPTAEQLAELDATIAALLAERTDADTEQQRARAQRKIDAAVARREKLTAQAEVDALTALRLAYEALCAEYTMAAEDRADAKAERDQAAERYYAAHAVYLAAEDRTKTLERQITMTFALQLAPAVRAALAPAMRAARARAGLAAPERHYAETDPPQPSIGAPIARHNGT